MNTKTKYQSNNRLYHKRRLEREREYDRLKPGLDMKTNPDYEKILAEIAKEDKAYAE